MADLLRAIIAQNRAGAAVAIASVCSAHPVVLRASLLLAQEKGRAVVIEATSNQVNQDGGYTGMRPADFVRFVHRIADAAAVDRGLILFGGDHLGPQVWRRGPAAAAMDRARVMVAQYVAAGFAKIHLDCSEGCADEPDQLTDALAAARAADLAGAAVAAARDPAKILLVIGTEVPPPGGARADGAEEIAPTRPEAAKATLDAHAMAFLDAGLGHLVPQIGGLVVQPGVEFSPMAVHHLPLARDPGLRAVMQDWPGLCLEAHSTDYQQPAVFPRLAALGFAFQKVGPALSFAYRQAIYRLDALRQIAGWATSPPLAEVMDRLMTADPRHWQGHYHGRGDLRVARQFGLADRIRYYWPLPEAQRAVAGVLADLAGRALPEPMVGQVFPEDILHRAEAIGGDRAEALILATIQAALAPYFFEVAP